MCYSILVQQQIEVFERRFGAIPVRGQFDIYERLNQLDSRRFKSIPKNPRIYPGYFALVLMQKDGKRFIVPMRYRIRPAGTANEVPAKYNVFNARRDSLTRRATWKDLIYNRHGVILLKRFYEWVEDESLPGKKKIISFSIPAQDEILVPVIWDYWQNETGFDLLSPKTLPGFFSFAVVTTEPPQSVLEGGHDRCPIVLSEDDVPTWLNPTSQNKEAIDAILDRPAPNLFQIGEGA